MNRTPVTLLLTAAAMAALGPASAATLSAYFNDGGVGTFDTATPGTLSGVFSLSPGEGPEFEIGANGNFYASVSRTAQTLNEYSPSGAFLRNVINDPAGSIYYTGMEITATTFYAAQSTQGSNNVSSTLGTVDLAAGTFTPIGVMTGTSGPTSGLAWDGTTMYAVTGGGTGPQLYSVDLSTGASTPIGSGVGFPVSNPAVSGLEFGSDGVLYALDRSGGANFDGALYTVDPSTGIFTAAGDFDLTISQATVNAIAAPPIPEPGSLLMAAMGALLLGRRHRDR